MASTPIMSSEGRPDGLQDFVARRLTALEAVGQVKRIPRVGFFVAELSADDIEDVYHWRR